MKVKCNVCVESPTIEIPHITNAMDGDEIHCPTCDKWIATAQIDRWHRHLRRWIIEDTKHKLDDGRILINYPIEILKQ